MGGNVNNSTRLTGRPVRHRGRRIGVLVGLVVVAARLLLGPWPSAVLLAAAGVGTVVWVWWRIEAKGRAVARPSWPINQTARAADAHSAFARGLTAVAMAYLAECEREARRP
jgi:hypothetical protein